MLQLKVLIRELVAVDALSPCSVTFGEVTPLDHEAWDDPMEDGTGESESLLSGAQCSEVLCKAEHNCHN